MAGLNTEITTRLTLARRPGCSVYDSNSYTSVDSFYDFRLFSSNSEQINVMVDQAAALYSLYNGVKTLVWNKSAGAGQSYMQSVGNSLYWGNGVDNKKWLQSLTVWASGATWSSDDTVGSTFLIDSNGNIQQLTAGTTFISGSTPPTWSTVVPSSANNFQGGLTVDGGVTWTNRGNPIMNWGIVNNGTAVTPTVGTSRVAWTKNTFYSVAGVIIDSNGNLQQVIAAGTSSAGPVTWATSVGNKTTDGTVTWMMIQTAASMVWASGTAYVPQSTLTLSAVANASGGHTVYTGTITGGGSNFYAGAVFTISGFTTAANNGTFLCSASTTTTLTLVNTAGVAQTLGAKAFTAGQYLIGSASGTNCLFNLAPSTQPYLTGSVSAYLYSGPTSGPVGCFILTNPTTTGSALASSTTLNSLSFTGTPLSSGASLAWATVNGAGATTGTTNPFPSYTANYQLIILTSIFVPVAGQYTFSIQHHDGMIWGIGNSATLISGTNDNPIGQTVTANQGYPVFGGTNRGLGGGGQWNDTFTVNFPTAGTYPVEVDYSYWYHSGQDLIVQCNGQPMANGTAISGATQPIWPSWSTAYAPNYPSVSEASGRFQWNNLGPTVDFAWASQIGFTLPDTTIIDVNGYTEAPYRSGVTGGTAPTFTTALNVLTADNPNLIWINEGIAPAPPTGTVSTYNGGWMYAVALVNTLDDTVSNASPLSAATGNFIGAAGVTIPPGAGLPAASTIDPQADYVAIYRTTDGQSTPFLIPGATTEYTVSLAEYLVSGYVDDTPDTGLNNLIQAAIAGENTPPAIGAINLTYHLNRIFYSIGNIIYWTSGPDTPDGNGVNGTAPANYDSFPSLVKRLVPTSAGLLVFTVSDVYLVQGAGTASSPIQTGVPIMQGVGLLSYNALDVNGSVVGFFTTDNQFCILNPSAGVDYAGFPIGDQFRLNNGGTGTSWDASEVYVAWHVEGEDQGWYVCDGATGWYRLMPTPSPEQGYTWSPFAQIVGGAGAVQSVEVSPGVHKLLIGPTGTGPLLKRDLSVWQDNGTSYPAWAVIGSAVLAQPGQVAVVGFITAESVRTGTPASLGVIFDEALPYYTGPWNVIKTWEPDPPGLTQSTSFYAQRFFMNEAHDSAACRHMQIKVQWNQENAQNELTSLTVYGAFEQEN